MACYLNLRAGRLEKEAKRGEKEVFCCEKEGLRCFCLEKVKFSGFEVFDDFAVFVTFRCFAVFYPKRCANFVKKEVEADALLLSKT